jgi:predicted ATPase/DNA-binding CsgD family transcriptional regulator
MLKVQFRHGAVFTPLAPLNTIDELLPALAGDLGIQLPPGGDLQQVLLHHLSDKQILLVLDNFEHLLEEAVLIREILVAGPQVRVLVTSREKLGLEIETLYHLRGLRFPAHGSLQKAEEFDAVRLFLQKARQAQPGFSLSDESIPGVVRICQQVEGIPLAILLAASCVEHFSPAEIADQISKNLDFLARDFRDMDKRHGCMRAVFDSSYNRLDEQKKAVFRKLAIFRGGFTLAAAEAVAGADLHTLLVLVDKSLLLRDPDTSRYDMHELLRQYAYERLDDAGERGNVFASHSNYYIAFLQERRAALMGQSQAKVLDEIQADFENIRQAWGWLIEKRDFSAIWNILPVMYAYCDMHSRFYEGEAIFRLASQGLAPLAGKARQPALALALLSWFDMRNYIERFESYEEITSQAHGCLEQAMSVHDPEGTAASLVLLGTIAEHQGDYEDAILKYKAGMQASPLLDEFYWVTMRIGLCYLEAGNYLQAIQTFQVCLQRGKKTGERVKMGWSLQNIGDTLLRQNHPKEAKEYLEQALALFQEVSTSVGIIWSNHSLSRVALASGDRIHSKELAEEALRIARQIHSINWIRKTEELLRQIEPHSKQPVDKSWNQGIEPFSQREIEVLQLLKSDMSGPEIARTLIISLNTVRYHTKNIYQKLQVNNRLEAINRAKELGI